MASVVRTKPGVEFALIAPAGFRLLSAVDLACQVLAHDLTLTCGTEGHPPSDPHSTGEAYDVRTSDLSEGQILALVPLLRKTLGYGFTVLYECPTKPNGVLAGLAYINPAATSAHIHIQRAKGTVFP